MPEKAQKRPIKPIAADAVKPQGVWRPESFEQEAQSTRLEIEAQVLEQMRAALKPKLDQELAALREAVKKEAHEAGYQAGYEAGYKAAQAEAKAEMAQEKQALIASHQQQIEQLSESLHYPLAAWDETLQAALGELLTKSLKALMASDPENMSHFFQQQLKLAIAQWRKKKIPFTVRAHPQWQALLADLFSGVELVTIELDEQLPSTRIEVEQETTLEVLDWRMMLNAFVEQLIAQFPSSSDQNEHAFADAQTDSTAQ